MKKSDKASVKPKIEEVAPLPPTAKIILLRHLQYGRERFYPGCPITEALALILKTKCINEESITALVHIGRVEVQYKDIKERPKR